MSANPRTEGATGAAPENETTLAQESSHQVPALPGHPLAELLARYKAVFSAAWALRHELAGPRRLAQEAAFLPAALSLQETPVHPAPRRTAHVLIGLFVIALAWASIGEVDIVAVAPGRVIVSERTKLIQPLERSVVRQVLVRDGDIVRAGQPLVELDPTTASADKATIGEQLRAAEIDQMRARALLQALAGQPMAQAPVVQPPADWSPRDAASLRDQTGTEWNDISARLARLAAEAARRQAEITTAREMLAKLEQTVPLARQREEDIRRLAEQGFMASHAGQDRTRERIELERDLATQRARLAEAQAALRESENSRAAYLAETRRTLADREAQADLKRQQAAQEQTKATHRERLTTLTAPVAGRVQQLAVHTTGGVVTEAQALMVIVPEGAQVSAEVALENKDIGFVQQGQSARIKLETFPFTRYGTLDATVAQVSADAVADEKKGAYYAATLGLARTTIDVDGKTIRLSPGMNLTAEIRTGKRRVIEYLLSPIQRAGDESLRER